MPFLQQAPCCCASACQSEGNPRPRRSRPPNGFNTPYWAGAVLADGPIRVDPISDAFWEYDNGVWKESRKVVARRLPRKIGRTFRTPTRPRSQTTCTQSCSMTGS